MRAAHKSECRLGGQHTQDHISKSSAKSASRTRSEQALRTISGEQHARRYLARLEAQHAAPDELAACVAVLSDAVSLAGFCRVIEKALGVRS